MTGDDLEEMGIPEGPAVTMVNCIAKDWPHVAAMVQAQLEVEDKDFIASLADYRAEDFIDPRPHSPAAPVTSGRSLSFAERDNPPAAQKPALSDAQEADLASFCKLTAHVTGAAAAREAMHLAGWNLTTALKAFYKPRGLKPTHGEDFIVRTDPASAGTKRKMESEELELEQVTSCRDHVRPKSQHLTMRAMGWARGARTAPAHPPTSSHSLPVSPCACRRRAHPPCHLPPRPRASAAPPPPRPNPTPSTGSR